MKVYLPREIQLTSEQAFASAANCTGHPSNPHQGRVERPLFLVSANRKKPRNVPPSPPKGEENGKRGKGNRTEHTQKPKTCTLTVKL